MKRILVLAVLALALPMAVFATSTSNIDFSNEFGTLSETGSNNALTLSGSTLIAISGLNGPGTTITGSDLGSVSFTTGGLIGTVGNVTTFAAGGSFTITGNGSGGPNGVLFQGTFSGPVTVKLFATLANGTNLYELDGAIKGTTASGFTTSGGTVQFAFNTGLGGFNGSATLNSGDTLIMVPEPGSLGLLGTGLIGLAGVVRRKLRA